MMPRLTDKMAREARTDRHAEIVARDDEIRGFGLRVTRAGARAWIFGYTVKSTGTERRMTIGSYPAWSVAQAREKAKELRRRVDEGGDPLGDIEAQRAAPSMDELCDRYVAEHLPKKRPGSAREDRGLIEQWVRPELGRRKVAEVTREDVRRLHAKISVETPTRANRVLSVLSMIFTLASGDWGLVADNPVKGIGRNREHPRERYLDPAAGEIARLVAALASHRECDPTNVDLITFLLLTGARRGETMQMTWNQVDLTNGVWEKPPGTTKQKRGHRVPLSPEAVELLRRRLPTGNVVALRPSDFVFSGPGKGRESALRKTWLRVCAAAGLTGVRLHDVRHSFASLLVSSGRTLPEIGALLGHRQVQTTARYSHLLDEPLRKAVAEVGRIVRGGK